jgi:F-type H+-transporting ATPase subunit delta
MATPTVNTSQTRIEQAQVLVQEIYRSEQLDILHLAIINLLDMVRDGEIDLVLEQSNKSTEQKELFIKKLVESLKAEGLQKELRKHLAEHDLTFFREKELGPFLQDVQNKANECIVVKVTVAIEFKEKDVKEMAASLSARLGKQVVLSIQVNPTLIGGAIVQHGSFLNDYSLKTQLDLYRSRWQRAVTESN